MIAQSTIKAAAMRIAEQFKPQKIILFGSYAYGKPNEDSDVDYMVLIKGRNTDRRAMEIRTAVDFGFPVDLLVKCERDFNRRIEMGDQFLIDINTAGKVLYEAADKGMGDESGRRFHNRQPRASRKKVA